MKEALLKPRFRKLRHLEEVSPRSAVINEAIKTGIAESKLGFPPSETDGLFRGLPVRIYYAGAERVVASIYNPERKSWSIVTLPANEFYKYYEPLWWKEYLEQLPSYLRERIRELEKQIYKNKYTPIAYR